MFTSTDEICFIYCRCCNQRHLRQEDTESSGCVYSLREENKTLKCDVIAANTRVEQLEAHDLKANLIIIDILPASWSEATSQPSSDNTVVEYALQTKKVVLELVENQIHIAITPQDISIAHPLKKKESMKPTPIIIRFTAFKMRHAHIQDQIQPQGGHAKVFINEDLTKTMATLFCEAQDSSQIPCFAHSVDHQ